MNNKICQIGEYIRENLKNPPTEDFLCDEFTITEYSLRKGFKQIFGLNLGEYGRKQRMQSAADLLADTENPISLIAECVGFRNASRFAEAFRNEFGMNPFQYRKTIKVS